MSVEDDVRMALDIARKLVERDAQTPDMPWLRRIEVGRGGLILLAQTVIDQHAHIAELEQREEDRRMDAMEASEHEH